MLQKCSYVLSGCWYGFEFWAKCFDWLTLVLTFDWLLRNIPIIHSYSQCQKVTARRAFRTGLCRCLDIFSHSEEIVSIRITIVYENSVCFMIFEPCFKLSFFFTRIICDYPSVHDQTRDSVTSSRRVEHIKTTCNYMEYTNLLIYCVQHMLNRFFIPRYTL